MTASKKTQARADRLAADYALELKEMEAQQRQMRAAIRAKKKELEAAQQAALENAQQALGAWIAGLAEATTVEAVEALQETLTGLGIESQLAAATTDSDDGDGDPDDASDDEPAAAYVASEHIAQPVIANGAEGVYATTEYSRS